MRVFVVDSHPIFRSGLAASIAALPEVEAVDDADTPRQAWEHPALERADVVLVDNELAGAADFIRAVGRRSDAAVVACSSGCEEADVLSAMRAGAIGFLCKGTLSADTLTACIRAAAVGASVMPRQLLGSFVKRATAASPGAPAPGGAGLTHLSSRERAVLRLVADGHGTREVARQLCFSERTIKNVLHDVTTKLNVRTRSQAVAFAVREGLI